MEALLESYLNERTYLSDDQKSFLKLVKEKWSIMKLFDKLSAVRSVIGFIGEDSPLMDEIKSLQSQLDQQQQKIAEKHINIYVKADSLDNPIGYTFMGYSENRRQKWIICGEESFVNGYMKVIDDDSAKDFQSKFIPKKELVNQENLVALDTKYGDTFKYERIMTFYSKKEPDDTNWKLITK